MVEGESLVVVVCGLGRVLLDGLLEPFEGHVVLLVLEVGEPQVVLGRSIVPVHVAGLGEVLDALGVLLDLAVAVAPVEEGLELGVAADLNLVEALAEVLDGLSEIHEAGEDEAPVEVVEAVVRLHGDGLVKLGEGVIDLVEHHHAVSPVGVVLGVLLVEADGRPEVVHRLLVVADRHEGFPPLGVVFGVGRALVVVGGRLQAGDRLAELQDCVVGILGVLLLGVLREGLPGLVVQLRGQLLLLDLVTVVRFLRLLALGLLHFPLLHYSILVTFPNQTHLSTPTNPYPQPTNKRLRSIETPVGSWPPVIGRVWRYFKPEVFVVLVFLLLETVVKATGNDLLDPHSVLPR